MSSRDTRPIGPSLAELRPGVHRLASRWSPLDLASALERAGWVTGVIDLVGGADKPTIMEAFASALGFPSWFGRNWDALDDALRDLSWWPAGPSGRVIIIVETPGPASGTSADRDILADVLDTAVERWATTSSLLVVLWSGAPPQEDGS